MIRHLLLLTLLFGAFSVASAQDDLPGTAQQASAQYQAGDYVAAIRSYESLTALGVRDSTVYINLGHAYFEARDLGRALLNYRRAQALQPRDNELSGDLARVRSLCQDVQGDETALVDSLAMLTSAVVTGQEFDVLMFVFWSLFFALLCLFILRVNWRDILRGPLIVLLLLLTLGLILWGSRAYVNRFRPAAVVMPDRVSILSGPGENYLQIYELHAAAELRILDQRDGWVRFILPDQRQGWVQQAAIEPV